MRELRTLPKAHLHLHLTGSARLSTIRELAQKYRISLPPSLMDKQLGGAAGGQDWSYFQGLYDAARQTIRSGEDVRRIIGEAAEDDAAEGSRWLELQVDPSSYARYFNGLEPAVEVMLAACRDAAQLTDIGIGLVLAVSWGASPTWAEELARVAARYAHHGVVGFGISNDERLGEPETFVPAARIARDAGLLMVPHGGFYTGHWHVRRCVELLGASRIGHGITATASPRTLEILRRKEVTMEICPTSYVPLGVLPAVAQVPIIAFHEAGVPVALGADDPLIFGTRLTGQYEIVRDTHGLGDGALAALARQSVRASSAPPEVAARLLADIDRWTR
ncbi:MAG TPA: adenosine deaminase [Pseudonocardiaceae bacterium]|nr:adenosine deaminase [Pseudonocardiaceae bacterium]